MRSAVLSLVALGLSLLSACSHAPWNPYSGWKVVRSKHITLYTDTRYLYGITLDSLEYAYAGLGASLFRRRSIAPVEVLFLEEPQLVATLGPFRNGATVARLPGHGFLGRRGLVVVAEGAHVPVAAHRLAHLFLFAMAPHAPLWVQEGYASYVETLTYMGDGRSATACLGGLFGGDVALVPLEQLFAWGWATYDESGKTDWYRHTARSLFDYFLSADDGKLRLPFAELLQQVSEGAPPAEALAKILPGVTLADLDRRLVEHRRASEMRPRGLCPSPFPVPLDQLADVGPRRIEEVPRQDMEQLMVQLWMLPRRTGYVDWYPPEALSLRGAGIK
jgi:hypothetical protein